MTKEQHIDLKYQPGSTNYAFDEDDYLTFFNYKRRWNPGFQFDSDWISHLRQTNGGKPIKNLFDTPSGRTCIFDFVYCFKKLDDRNSGDVGRIHTLACDSEAFHYNCIPFGQLPNGDLLCFDHRENPGGPAPVVIWLHEESDEDAPVFEYVAPTFRDFVAMLYKTEA